MKTFSSKVVKRSSAIVQAIFSKIHIRIQLNRNGSLKKSIFPGVSQGQEIPYQKRMQSFAANICGFPFHTIILPSAGMLPYHTLKMKYVKATC